jgi:glycosyltransferase involved in cell wall biosynthesis
VIFTGMILDEKKVASFYAQADIFVSASPSETFGFTVAEAMACGTPAVVVKSGAFPHVYDQIVENMFDFEDKQGYAECCHRVFHDLEKHSLFARNYAVKGYSIDASINDLIKTYYWIVDGCKDTKHE